MLRIFENITNLQGHYEKMDSIYNIVFLFKRKVYFLKFYFTLGTVGVAEHLSSIYKVLDLISSTRKKEFYFIDLWWFKWKKKSPKGPYILILGSQLVTLLGEVCGNIKRCKFDWWNVSRAGVSKGLEPHPTRPECANYWVSYSCAFSGAFFPFVNLSCPAQM